MLMADMIPWLFSHVYGIFFYGKSDISFDMSKDLACEMALKLDPRLTTRRWLVEKVPNVDWKLKEVRFYEGCSARELGDVWIFFCLKKN